MEVKKCPCCGSKKIRRIYKNLKDKNHFIEGTFDIMSCQECNIEFLNPLLNEKQLARYYPKQDYYSFKKKSYLPLFYHQISSLYYAKKSFLLNFLLYPFSSLLYTYHINKESKDKKILEIGCGDGLGLEIYKRYELKTKGIEPYGNKLTEREKSLGIERKSIKQAKFKENEFDYIILKEVLEHIPNQGEIFKKSHEWLKPEGKLILTLPNKESWVNKIFKQNWYGYDVPRHVYNYSPKSIERMLKKYGFKVKRIRKYELPYMITGSIKFKKAKKKEKLKIVESPIATLFFTPISLILTYLKKGSIMEIEAIKLTKDKEK